MSPLLRLPPEIRNRIWSYACGGQLVMLPENSYWYWYEEKGGAICFEPEKELILTIGNVHTIDRIRGSPTEVISAFHLPEVCRQIYAETALTSYRENIFLCDSLSISRTSHMSRLIVAQRRAITTVEFHPRVLWYIIDLEEDKLPRRITTVLPNVRSFSITKLAMEYVRLRRMRNRREPRESWSQEQWRAWVTARLKQWWKIDGVEAVFEV